MGIGGRGTRSKKKKKNVSETFPQRGLLEGSPLVPKLSTFCRRVSQGCRRGVRQLKAKGEKGYNHCRRVSQGILIKKSFYKIEG